MYFSITALQYWFNYNFILFIGNGIANSYIEFTHPTPVTCEAQFVHVGYMSHVYDDGL